MAPNAMRVPLTTMTTTSFETATVTTVTPAAKVLGIQPELIDPVEIGADRVELLPGRVEVGLGVGLRRHGDEGHGEQYRCQEHAEEGAGADRHLRRLVE